MTPDAIERAASELVTSRRAHRQLKELPEAFRPATPAEGYQVQNAVIRQWGEPVAGWKAGATAKPVQDKFGLNEPFLGPFFGSTVMQSPATAEAAAYSHKPLAAGAATREIALEVEFAFRLGRDLPAREQGYSREDVVAAMDALVPALEIISPRFESVPFHQAPSALADCGLNGGMILGTPITDWRKIDLVTHKTRQLADGAVLAEGTGALVLGDPLVSLTWLVDTLAKRGVSLTKGQIFTTGSMTGIVYVKQGAQAVGDFGSLGKVEVRFV